MAKKRTGRTVPAALLCIALLFSVPAARVALSAAPEAVPAGTAATPASPSVDAGAASVAAVAAPEPPADFAPGDRLQDSIAQWIAALADEPGFEAWRDAYADVLPLGPGTHAWVVHLLAPNHTAVGYLLIGATPDGKYKLLEYGTGDMPLYSLQTLHRSLVRHAIIDPYVDYTKLTDAVPGLTVDRLLAAPLLAVWKVTADGTVAYFDAKTGEKLPDLERLSSRASRQPEQSEQRPADIADHRSAQAAADGRAPESGKGHRPPDSVADTEAEIRDDSAGPANGPVAGPPDEVTASAFADAVALTIQTEAFDPFFKVGWLTGTPLAIPSAGDFVGEWRRHGQLTCVVKFFDGSLTYPLAVTGYQEWKESGAYVALEQDGTRFVPLQELVRHGKFYP